MTSKIEYLGHEFNFNKNYEMCFCLKCKLQVYLPFEEEIYRDNIKKGNKFLYHKNGEYISGIVNSYWSELTLTCDEIIIKNIIE